MKIKLMIMCFCFHTEHVQLLFKRKRKLNICFYFFFFLLFYFKFISHIDRCWMESFQRAWILKWDTVLNYKNEKEPIKLLNSKLIPLSLKFDWIVSQEYNTEYPFNIRREVDTPFAEKKLLFENETARLLLTFVI